MARAARGMSGELRGQIDRAADGSRWSLVVVAVLAVGREGLETALFLWAATQAGTRDAAGSATPTWEPLLGAALGLATAVVLGYLIYRGAITINLSRFFTWTGGFLILVAAGVLSYGVHDLQEAGILPGLNTLAFDVSGTIDPGSWYAVLLKGVFNFSPATTVLEAVVWVLYLVPTMTALPPRRAPPRHRPPPLHARARPGRALTRPPRTHPMRIPLLAGRPRWRPPPSARAPRTPRRPRRRTTARSRSPRPTTAATCPPARPPAAPSPSTSPTPARRSPSSTCYAEDGQRIVGEVENIGPGLTRELRVSAPAGTYVTACKPGMTGDGIRADFTVTDSGAKVGGRRATHEQVEHAPARSTQAYVQDQSDQLLAEHRAVRDGLQGRRRRRPPAPCTPTPACTGSGSSRRGVVRRPRPEARRPRGRPRAGPEVDRLAPAREGPVAGPRRELRAR